MHQADDNNDDHVKHGYDGNDDDSDGDIDVDNDGIECSDEQTKLIHLLSNTVIG